VTTERDERTSRRYGRRNFLAAVGTGAAGAVAAGTGTAAAQTRPPPPSPGGTPSDRFGRMFPQLPPFADATPQVQAALREIGRAGGILDAKDALDRGPTALIVDPALNVNNPNNPDHTAGTTFMGQFLDHDMTFDGSSPLGTPTSPGAVVNVRTPALDLDSVYGGGPNVSPHLYDPADRAKLKVGFGGLFEDLPRDGDNRALLGDPRNDEHVILAGLHAAFLLFHNRVVDRVRGQPNPPADAFQAARQLTTWHYQWMILNEFLPLFIGPAMMNTLRTQGRRFYTPSTTGPTLIPVEFQGAAYRFGHSMVRPSYRANMKGDGGQPFFAFIFDPAGQGQADPVDLRGGAKAPRRFVGWQTFFDFGIDPFTGVNEVKPNKLIDTKISTPLFRLPLGAIASGAPPISLAERNLLRHLTWNMPSGQRIASLMGVPALTASELSELSGFGLGLERSTPLWYYVLKEAEIRAAGRHLGPVGGRIVGEVFLGLLQTDPNSYLVRQPSWVPTLPRRNGAPVGDFRMVDFLTFARVDPTRRGQ
jgi:hypothetical protein